MEIEPGKATERLESMGNETALLKQRLARLRHLQSQPAAQQDELSMPRTPTPEEREELRTVMDQHAVLHAKFGKMLSEAKRQYGATLEGGRLPTPERARDRYRQQIEAVLSDMVAKGASPEEIGRVRALVNSMLAGL